MVNIEFNGEISQESKDYIIKENDKGYMLGWIGFPIILYLIVLPCFVISVKLGIVALVVVSVFSAIMFFIPRVHYNPAMLEDDYPIKVVVEGHELITEGKGENAYNSRSVDDVKSVIDCGNFYYIKYYYPFYRFTLCQKNLLVEGTIEEFEEFFEGKIVRKIKKTK